jgi:ABC-type bacteriocin/lantibiotic exporter with double-glycine peptidase domain
VRFQYLEQPVIDDISFSLGRGERLGISGISGKGKTTLVHILLGFLSPIKGKILVNGENVPEKQLRAYWASISYVRQQPFFIYDTVLRNITLQENRPDEERLQKAIYLSGLDKTLELFPEGIQKMITENGKNISGGQQQRIALARAFYKKADLLILDEPFNELDEKSTREILEKIEGLSDSGMIIIIISHDRSVLSHCNKVISLDDEA